jgi:hypothetical protein
VGPPKFGKNGSGIPFDTCCGQARLPRTPGVRQTVDRPMTTERERPPRTSAGHPFGSLISGSLPRCRGDGQLSRGRRAWVMSAPSPPTTATSPRRRTRARRSWAGCRREDQTGPRGPHSVGRRGVAPHGCSCRSRPASVKLSESGGKRTRSIRIERHIGASLYERPFAWKVRPHCRSGVYLGQVRTTLC